MPSARRGLPCWAVVVSAALLLACRSRDSVPVPAPVPAPVAAPVAAPAPAAAGDEVPSDPIRLPAADTRVPSVLTTLHTTGVQKDFKQSIRAVALRRPYAYVLDRSGGLWVFKLPDKAGEKPTEALEEVGRIAGAGDGNALTVIGDALLCSHDGSLAVFSLKDPARPERRGKFGSEAPARSQSIVRLGGRVVLVGPGALSVFDVSNPAEPRHLGTTRAARYQWNGCAVGDRLYVAEADIPIPGGMKPRRGIAIYDPGDPRELKELAFVETTGTPYHFLPVGKDRLAVLMDGTAQLFSTADPLQPAPLGKAVPASARTGAVLDIGGKTYLSTGRELFRIDDQNLVCIGAIGSVGNPDGFPYQASTEGDCAAIPGSQAVVVLRAESPATAHLDAPEAPGPGVPALAPAPAGPSVSVGQELELAGPTVEGEKFNLKRLRGKVVLIDFWATWCGPCVGEMPNVLRVYKRYHKDGFEVVGVSLDNSREALVQFLEAKEVAWPQIFFPDKADEGWQNPLARKYAVNAIPSTVLVGREGKVVQVGVRGKALEPAVAKLLGKEPASEAEAEKEEQAIREMRFRPAERK